MAKMIIGSCLPCTRLREHISLRSKCEDRIEFSERFIGRNASGKKWIESRQGKPTDHGAVMTVVQGEQRLRRERFILP